MQKHWNTTLAGSLTAIVAIGAAALAVLTGDSTDWTATIAAVTAAIGLLFAEDGKK